MTPKIRLYNKIKLKKKNSDTLWRSEKSHFLDIDASPYHYLSYQLGHLLKPKITQILNNYKEIKDSIECFLILNLTKAKLHHSASIKC